MILKKLGSGTPLALSTSSIMGCLNGLGVFKSEVEEAINNISAQSISHSRKNSVQFHGTPSESNGLTKPFFSQPTSGQKDYKTNGESTALNNCASSEEKPCPTGAEKQPLVRVHTGP